MTIIVMELRMCNVAQSKIAPAHAEPAQEKSVIYRKKHLVAMERNSSMQEDLQPIIGSISPTWWVSASSAC